MRRLNKLRSVAERLAASPESAANDPAELWKLLAEEGAEYDVFGNSVALSADGGTVLIGVSLDDEQGEHAGAYIFAKGADGSWSQQTKLIADDGHDWMLWCTSSVSLSADGQTALVGAMVDNIFKGAAYVFIKHEDGSWSQQAKLTANDGAEWDWFGDSVSLSADGQAALIGATAHWDYLFPPFEGRSGSAYIFVKGTDGTWSQQVKLAAEDSAAGNRFGCSVSLSTDGQIALVGASTFSGNIFPPGEGSAYVFAKIADGSWSQQAKLNTSDGAAGDWFGCSVSLSTDGQAALIGASGDDDRGENSGSAYIFVKGEEGTWSQQLKLTADDGAADDWFGGEVSLSADGRIALIGARRDDDRGENSGSAYVFVKREDGTWSQRFKLTAEDGEEEDGFGASVSLSADGRMAMIGAPSDDDRGTNSGSVYVFSIPPANATAPVSMMRLRR